MGVLKFEPWWSTDLSKALAKADDYSALGKGLRACSRQQIFEVLSRSVELAAVYDDGQGDEKTATAVELLNIGCHGLATFQFLENFFWEKLQETLYCPPKGRDSLMFSKTRLVIHQVFMNEWRVGVYDERSRYAFRRICAMGWPHDAERNGWYSEFPTEKGTGSRNEEKAIVQLIREHIAEFYRETDIDDKVSDVASWFREPEIPTDVCRTLMIALVREMERDALNTLQQEILRIWSPSDQETS